jgi:hypothetical protein
MEHSNDVKISIPTPCHEDWNKMTPNEKGAFCGKCAKTVVDFTKKTATEIRDFLVEQSEKKICGRFMSDQLHKPVKTVELYIPLHLLPRKLSFSKNFVFALFIVFGTSLFSCSTPQGEIVGKIATVRDPDAMMTKGEVVESQLTCDTVVNVLKPLKICEPLQGDVKVVEPVMVGEIAMPPDSLKIQKDTIEPEEIKQGKLKIE